MAKTQSMLIKEYYNLLTPDNIKHRIASARKLDQMTKLVLDRVITHYKDIVSLFFTRHGGRGTISNFIAYVADNATFFAANAPDDPVFNEYFKHNLAYTNALLGLENKQSLGLTNINESAELIVKAKNEVVFSRKIQFADFRNNYLNIITCENYRRDYMFLTHHKCHVYYISRGEESIFINEIEYKNEISDLTFVCSYDTILVGNIYFIRAT